MKVQALSIIILFLMNCHTSPVLTDGDYLTAEATLSNNLPVDGCDWHLSILTGDHLDQYVPDVNSKSKVDQIIQSIQTVSPNGLYSSKVEMTYKLTGTKSKVQCGWGKTLEMEELNIKSIKKI